jgi:hypothetical protein
LNYYLNWIVVIFILFKQDKVKSIYITFKAKRRRLFVLCFFEKQFDYYFNNKYFYQYQISFIESFVRQFFTNLSQTARCVKDVTLARAICAAVAECVAAFAADVDRHLAALFGVASW